MAWSDSLDPWPLIPAPRFVNNDYVTAETTYSPAHACHEACAWPRLACGPPVWASPRKPWPLPRRGYTGAAARLGSMRLCCGSVTAALRFRGRCCYRCRASREGTNAPAVPMLLSSPSRRSAHGLPTLGSADSESSVISNTTGIVSRMNSNAMTKEVSLKHKYKAGLGTKAALCKQKKKREKTYIL